MVLKRWKTYVYLMICVIATLIFFLWSSSFLSVDYGKKKEISLELFASPKYDLTVNLTLEIPRLNISTQIVQNPYYNITKRPVPWVKQIVSVNFHLVCNESKDLHVVVNELEPIEGWFYGYDIYDKLISNDTNNSIIKEYFSTFIIIYTVKTSWLNGLSEITIFRDAYDYGEASKRENHYATERIPFLISTLSVTLSLVIFGLTLIPIPNLRKISFTYYPWLTISIICVSILVFIFWTPPQFWFFFGPLSMFLSYFPHFDSTHLIGNLELGTISLFLLESWIGGALAKSAKIKLEILTLIIGSEFIFWIVGLGGFGASYVNEVLGTLLIAHIIYHRKNLTRTKIRLIIYPIACFFAGYALFRYIVDWFVSGYIYHSSLEDANLHIAAFALGIPLVLASFLAQKEFRKEVLYFFRKCYEFLKKRLKGLRVGGG